MKNQALQLLLYFVIILCLSSCFDSKSEQSSRETYLSDEQYDYSRQDESYFEEDIDVEFTNSSEVLNYLSDKNFTSPDGSKRVHIGYDGVSINGTPAYFNLDITVAGKTTAYIKGQSLNNPNGVINIQVDGSRNCIYNDGVSFCTN